MPQLKRLRDRLSPRQLANRERRRARRRDRPVATVFGLLTIERHSAERFHGRFWHVFVDGVNVTKDCVSADDRHGWALLYVRDRKGQIIRTLGVPRTKLVAGVVTMERGPVIK